MIRRARLLRMPTGGRSSCRRPGSPAAWLDQAPRLLVPERLVGGTAKYLAGITGRDAGYGRDQVAARLATSEEAQLLELAEPAAVLVYRFTVYSKDDQPIQTDDATYPPDQWAFRQEYPLSR